ncbi:MAG: DUF3149 domain-containing protein [Betaproteobacteria bacterium]|nr:DUF3149 domain-containing protein [Betaproteobacteria bacterium]
MAWKELFSTDIGLLSLFTIGFIVVMAGYLIHYAIKKVDEDAKHAK